MKTDCVFFESITNRWAYCSEKEEFSLKDDEDFCNNCQHYSRKTRRNE